MMRENVVWEDFPVKNWKFEGVDNVKLSSFIFDQEPREDILHRVVLWQLAKRRAGTHKTKGISDVSGTTRKPYKQKGTGRARQGSLRSPQFRGGAVIFGPVVRSHEFSLQKKVRKMGLRMALSLKKREGLLTVMDNADAPITKTKDFNSFLTHFSSPSVLFVVEDGQSILGARNIASVNALSYRGMNVYDILNHDHLVLSKGVVQYLEGFVG